jgi:hypothetical protein
MFVKIIKCSGDTFWYKNEIGKIFKVNNKEPAFEGNCYMLYDNSDGIYAKGIHVEDCEIVNDEDIIVKKYGIEYRKPNTIVHNATVQYGINYQDYFLLFNTESEMLRKLAEIKNESHIEDLNVFIITIDKNQNKEPYKI